MIFVNVKHFYCKDIPVKITLLHVFTHMIRSRDCLGDLPGYGNCTGDEDDMRLCNLTACPIIGEI